MEDRTPPEEGERARLRAETEDLRRALQHAVLKIVLDEDRRHRTRTSPHAVAALTELTFQYAAYALVPDVHAFAAHAGRRSTVAPDDVALAVRKLPPRQAGAFRAAFCRGGGGGVNSNNTSNVNTTATASSSTRKKTSGVSEPSNCLAMKRKQSKSPTNDRGSTAGRRKRSEIELSPSSSSSSDEATDADAGRRRGAAAGKAALPTASRGGAPPSGVSTSRFRGLDPSRTREQREALLSKFEPPPPTSDGDSSSSDGGRTLTPPAARRAGGAATASKTTAATSAVRREAAASRTGRVAATKRGRPAAGDPLAEKSSRGEEYEFEGIHVGGPPRARNADASDVALDRGKATATGRGRRPEDPFDEDQEADADGGNVTPQGNSISHLGAKRCRPLNETTGSLGYSTNAPSSTVLGHSKHSQVALTLANLSDSGMSETNETDNEADREANGGNRKPHHHPEPVASRRARRPRIESDEDE